jgi:hypothetical protein
MRPHVKALFPSNFPTYICCFSLILTIEMTLPNSTRILSAIWKNLDEKRKKEGVIKYRELLGYPAEIVTLEELYQLMI